MQAHIAEEAAAGPADPASSSSADVASRVGLPAGLATRVLVSRRASASNGTSAKLEAHEALSVRDLLFGAMLPSGNDAATALAEHFGRYCEPDAEVTWRPFERAPHYPAHTWERTDPLSRFVAEMNRAAAALGMSQTVCANPHGLVHARASSCAADVAMLVAAAWTEAAFREAAGAAKHACEAVAVPLALQAAALASGARDSLVEAGSASAPSVGAAAVPLPSSGAAPEAGTVAPLPPAVSDDSTMAAAMMRRPRLQRSPPRASALPALSAPPGTATGATAAAEQSLAVIGSVVDPGIAVTAATAVTGGGLVSAAPPAAASAAAARGPSSHRVVSGRARSGAATVAAPTGPVVRKVSATREASDCARSGMSQTTQVGCVALSCPSSFHAPLSLCSALSLPLPPADPLAQHEPAPREPPRRLLCSRVCLPGLATARAADRRCQDGHHPWRHGLSGSACSYSSSRGGGCGRGRRRRPPRHQCHAGVAQCDHAVHRQPARPAVGRRCAGGGVGVAAAAVRWGV